MIGEVSTSVAWFPTNRFEGSTRPKCLEVNFIISAVKEYLIGMGW